VTPIPVPTTPPRQLLPSAEGVESRTCMSIATLCAIFLDPRSASKANSSTDASISVGSVGLIKVPMRSLSSRADCNYLILGRQRSPSTKEQRDIRTPPLAERPWVPTLDTGAKQTINPSVSKERHQYWGRWNHHPFWRLLFSL